MTVSLSICIPTYNRAAHLANCLESIRSAAVRSGHTVQVCVSDNGSTDDTAKVVAAAQATLPIVYYRSPVNLGRPRNYIKAVAMAEGEFVWLIGDDDLLMPDAIGQVGALLDRHPTTDFFYVNAFHLTTEYVESFPQPFATSNLPASMEPFSPCRTDRDLTFFELISPKISFDFLGGMFLAVFRRRLWMAHASQLGDAAFDDRETFSNFDNTFPHVKIFAAAFARSAARLHTQPLIVCLTGAREWWPLYPMVRSVRLVEALDAYRANGMSWLRYVWCRHYALRTFIPDLAYMYFHRADSGYHFVSPARLIASNALYPNMYLSVVYYCVRKLRERGRAAVQRFLPQPVAQGPGGNSQQ